MPCPFYTGFAVTQLLEENFEELVDYGFTSLMEQTLDDIAEGKKESVPYLTQFFLGDKGLQSQIARKDKKNRCRPCQDLRRNAGVADRRDGGSATARPFVPAHCRSPSPGTGWPRTGLGSRRPTSHRRRHIRTR